MSARLHGYWRSSATWRVRIALHWKSIPYEVVPVSLVRDGGEQLTAAYGALNPAQLVPALEIDGIVLSESLAIVSYLDMTRPAAPLLPASPVDRAAALRLAELVNAGVQPLQNLRVLKRLETQFGATERDQSAWAAHWIGEGLGAVEDVLRATAGTHAVGDAVTVADLCIVPQLYHARRFGVDPSAFPRCVAVEAAVLTHAAFNAARPEVQPDAPRS